MDFTDKNYFTGEFAVNIYRNGVLIDQVDEKNLIVNLAKNQLAKLIGGDGANRHIQKIGFGTGTSAATPDDSTITSPYIKNLSGHTYPSTDRVAFTWSLSSAEANGKHITEFALICADDVMFSHKVRAPISKDEDISLTGTWTIIF